MSEAPVFSVVVATYRRPRAVAALLQALREQSPSVTPSHEVIVVDNGSQPEVHDLVEQARREGAAPHRYLREATRGASAARNAGIRAARGRYVALLDDDSLPTEAWLLELERAHELYGADCVGGRVVPCFPFREGGAPPWWDMRLARFQSCEYGQEALDLTRRRICPVGANSSIARRVFERCGLFDHHLGWEEGENLAGAGEENDFFERARRAGFRIVYAPRALVHHHLSPDRFEKEAFEATHYWDEVSRGILDYRYYPRWYRLARSGTLSLLAALHHGPAALLSRGRRREGRGYYHRVRILRCRAYLQGLQLAERAKRQAMGGSVPLGEEGLLPKL